MLLIYDFFYGYEQDIIYEKYKFLDGSVVLLLERKKDVVLERRDFFFRSDNYQNGFREYQCGLVFKNKLDDVCYVFRLESKDDKVERNEFYL